MKKTSYEYRKEATARYHKTGTKQYIMRLTKTTDADIVEWLDSLDNKQGYIKQLIRDDMARRKGMKA